MKEFSFIAYCTFGKGDSGETLIDVALADEDANRLVQYGTQADYYYKGFANCEELKDLYSNIYELAVKQITEELRDTSWLDEMESSDPDFRADYVYNCKVMFPEEFEEMLKDE